LWNPGFSEKDLIKAGSSIVDLSGKNHLQSVIPTRLHSIFVGSPIIISLERPKEMF